MEAAVNRPAPAAVTVATAAAPSTAAAPTSPPPAKEPAAAPSETNLNDLDPSDFMLDKVDGPHALAIEEKMATTACLAVMCPPTDGADDRGAVVAYAACMALTAKGTPFAKVLRASSEDEIGDVDGRVRGLGEGVRSLVWLHVPTGADFEADDIVGWIETLEAGVHLVLSSDGDEGRALLENICYACKAVEYVLEAPADEAPIDDAEGVFVNETVADWNAAYEKIAHDVSKRSKDKGMSKQTTSGSFGLSSFKRKGGAFAEVNGYRLGKRLGKGAYGEVFLATKNAERYAMKVLKQSALKKARTGSKGSALDSVQKEIATMKKIVHPNCVALFDVIADPASGVDEICLLLEFVAGGESQATDEHGAPVPLSCAAIWSHTRHLVMGLEYLHMHGIVHRDIKPENLMLTRHGVLKIADFGTSALMDDPTAGAQQRVVGTPHFFAPELCAIEGASVGRAHGVDLWAVGATLYLWVAGRTPFNAETQMLLMAKIRDCDEVVAAPPEASAHLASPHADGLAAVISGLLTKDVVNRVTLSQLRHHPWLTVGDTMPLPGQPVGQVFVTDAEVAMAFTNRQEIAYQSVAGPSTLGAITGYQPNWKREGLNAIRKKATAEEGNFYRAIDDTGHLAPHIPVLYEVRKLEEGEVAAEAEKAEKAAAAARASTPSFHNKQGTVVHMGSIASDEVYKVQMQDLAAGMMKPCGLGFVMGVRTATQADFRHTEPRAEVLEACRELDPSAPTPEETAQGGMSQLRHLEVLDSISSTATLGFRIDAARTVVDGEVEPLPLPGGTTLETLREEADVVAAIARFVQNDASVARTAAFKADAIVAAWEKASDFTDKHVLLRTTLLLVYDDANREKCELKFMNFAHSYHVNGGGVKHDAPWDGTAECHEDGWLTGIRNLARAFKSAEEACGAKPLVYC